MKLLSSKSKSGLKDPWRPEYKKESKKFSILDIFKNLKNKLKKDF